MNMDALLQLIPEVVLLSTFPFTFYWFTRPLSPSYSSHITAGGLVKGIIGLVCVLFYLSVSALYALFWLSTYMSGSGAGPYPANRLLQSPLQVPICAFLLPALASGLAVAKKGTLGLWAFAIGTGFITFWAGLGWLPTELDPRFFIALTAVGALGGAAAGYILLRLSRLQVRSSKVLPWAVVGACSSAIGVLASWVGVQSAAQRATYSEPPGIELTPFSIDPWAMLGPLAVAVIVWLFLGTFVAVSTGYIKLGRGLLPVPGSAPE